MHDVATAYKRVHMPKNIRGGLNLRPLSPELLYLEPFSFNARLEKYLKGTNSFSGIVVSCRGVCNAFTNRTHLVSWQK